jgi:hypothetical protein
MLCCVVLCCAMSDFQLNISLSDCVFSAQPFVRSDLLRVLQAAFPASTHTHAPISPTRLDGIDVYSMLQHRQHHNSSSIKSSSSIRNSSICPAAAPVSAAGLHVDETDKPTEAPADAAAGEGCVGEGEGVGEGVGVFGCADTQWVVACIHAHDARTHTRGGASSSSSSSDRQRLLALARAIFYEGQVCAVLCCVVL